MRQGVAFAGLVLIVFAIAALVLFDPIMRLALERLFLPSGPPREVARYFLHARFGSAFAVTAVAFTLAVAGVVLGLVGLFTGPCRPTFSNQKR